MESYSGEYEDSLYSGEGVAQFVGGNVYEGTFLAGRMHGKGKYRWTTDVEYEGDFRDNVIRYGLARLFRCLLEIRVKSCNRIPSCNHATV